MDHVDPPTTIKEIGIHIGYMRQDMAEMKSTLQAMPSAYVTKEDHNKLDRRVTKLETKNNLKQTLLWVGLVASAIINIVVIYRLFTGER